jgi:pimeloyl-ACP methyl ester carboxylesterase
MVMGPTWLTILGFFTFFVFFASASAMQSNIDDKETAASFDGVEIVYSVQGKNEPALVFVHGGFADRTFWADQMKHFSRHHKVIALDLAGHGDSGKNRKDWSVDTFAEDVAAVIRKEKIKKAVLIGNSLGGPVCIKTVHLVPDAIMAVVAVDTFQDIGVDMPTSFFLDLAKSYRTDFVKTMKEMVNSLFHPDSYPELKSWAENRMMDSSPEMAATLMESYVDFDLPGLVRKINIPIRCINGDLYETQVEKNRAIHADFDAVIMPNTGHYPMLENPEHFNSHLEKILKDLEKK